MSKVSGQMGNSAMDMAIVKKTFLPACFFAITRDLVSRGSFKLSVDQLLSFNQEWISRDINRKYHIYFGSAILATLLSHPFDVLYTKIASQRTKKYTGLLSTFNTIVK